MTLKELIEKIERIKELQASGVKPDYFSYGVEGELAQLLNERIEVPAETSEE